VKPRFLLQRLGGRRCSLVRIMKIFTVDQDATIYRTAGKRERALYTYEGFRAATKPVSYRLLFACLAEMDVWCGRRNLSLTGNVPAQMAPLTVAQSGLSRRHLKTGWTSYLLSGATPPATKN